MMIHHGTIICTTVQQPFLFFTLTQSDILTIRYYQI